MLSASNECEIKIFPRKFLIPKKTTLLPYADPTICPLNDHILINKWLEWIFKFCQMNEEQFDKIKGTGIFVAHFYPTCNSIDRYENCWKGAVLAFILDDHMENNMENNRPYIDKICNQLRQVLGVLVDFNSSINISEWEPVVLANFAVWRQICNMYDPNQKKRFIDGWYQWINELLKEAALFESNINIDNFNDFHNEFLDIRNISGGCNFAFMLIEIANDLVFNENDLAKDLIQKFLRKCGYVIVLMNDVHSFEKEYMAKNGRLEKMFNAVAIISRMQGYDINKAIEKVVEIFTQYEKEVLELFEKIKRDNQFAEQTKKLCQLALFVASGNVLAAIKCDRYNKF